MSHRAQALRGVLCTGFGGPDSVQNVALAVVSNLLSKALRSAVGNTAGAVALWKAATSLGSTRVITATWHLLMLILKSPVLGIRDTTKVKK